MSSYVFPIPFFSSKEALRSFPHRHTQHRKIEKQRYTIANMLADSELMNGIVDYKFFIKFNLSQLSELYIEYAFFFLETQERIVLLST